MVFGMSTSPSLSHFGSCANFDGNRNAALVSMAFGLTGVILCLFLEDIEPKMTPKIEIFLENDALADKNKYH